MKLLVGLGNPGKDYENTRHNFGRLVITMLASELKLKFNDSSKLQASLSETKGQGIGEKIILAYPKNFMNNSGTTVKLLSDYFKILPEDIYIIHDDLDLEVGDYRIQFDRGPAGHNGIISIIDKFGTQSFHRIRLGIGHPQDLTPVEKYVLMPFLPEERIIISSTVKKLIEEIRQLINL